MPTQRSFGAAFVDYSTTTEQPRTKQIKHQQRPLAGASPSQILAWGPPAPRFHGFGYPEYQRKKSVLPLWNPVAHAAAVVIPSLLLLLRLCCLCSRSGIISTATVTSERSRDQSPSSLYFTNPDFVNPARRFCHLLFFHQNSNTLCQNLPGLS